ncbi:MAG: terminase family protein [Kiritimatiellales bacterium]
MSKTGDKFFLPYQARWIQDMSRLKLMEKSRQIGLSWSTAYGLVRRKSLKTAKLDAWISSRDDLQARLFKDDCNNFAHILQTVIQDLGDQIIDEEKKISAYVLQLANGCRIHSMSSNPDAQAGKRGDRVLDEFALHPNPRKLYSIAFPGITWGGQLEIISTHRGSQNFFNELVEEIKHKGNPKGFSLHTVTLQDALDQGFLNKLKAKLPEDDPRQFMDAAAYYDFIRAGCPDEETFNQEYMCVPSDDATAFLSYEMITSCAYRFGDEWELPLTGALYVGVDIGRVRDFTAIWILEKLGDVFYTRRLIVLDNVPFSEQEAVLYQILELPSVRRCCIDNTGIGRQFAERAKQRFGEYRIEEVTFTAAVKEELAYPLRAAFEDRTVRIPDDRDVCADLRAVKKMQTASGNVRFAADRGTNGHADRFWALALALHAAKCAPEVYAYEPAVSKPAGEQRFRDTPDFFDEDNPQPASFGLM